MDASGLNFRPNVDPLAGHSVCHPAVAQQVERRCLLVVSRMKGPQPMNYYEARKLKDGSGWHFTSYNKRPRPDGITSPVGYCQDHPGHETREEAEQCFHRYLLDGQREESYGDWTGCEVCDEPTKKGLTTRPPLGNGFPLCDEHRTPETLKSLVSVPGQICASY